MVGARCTKIPWTAWWRQFTTRGWWASTRGSCHAGWEWLLGPSLSGFHSRKYGGSVGPSLGNNCHKAKPECNAIKCNSSKSIFTIIRLNGIRKQTHIRKQTFEYPHEMLTPLEKQTESKSYQLKNELSQMKAVSMEKPWKFCQTWTKYHLLHAHADGKCQFVIHVLTFSLKEIHLLLSERALVILAFKLLFSDEIYKSNRFESYSSGHHLSQI